MTANLNALTPSALALLLRHAGEVALQADSLAAAVVDWRDADDDTVSLGAERAWYQQRGRPSPRNDAFGALEELHLVRGFERLTTFDTLFGVRAERILWTRAPSAVLRALPGMTDEALVVLAQRGRRSLDGLQFLVTLPELSKAARDTLSAHMPELVASLTSAPESWTVTATAASGRPAISVTIATTFTLAERRLIVLRQVITP